MAPEGSGFYERIQRKGRAPLYVDDILWNFEKFLVDRQGNVIERFSPGCDAGTIRSWWRRLKERWRNNGVSMQLQDVEAAGRLAPFSAAFRAGEIVHLVGPNGAGKSTLLTRMAGAVRGPRHGSF